MNNVHVVNAGKRMNNVFVVNAGSSSLKYQLIDMESEQVLVSGNCERIGIDGGKITYKYFGAKKVVETDLPNHKAALDRVVDLLLSGETKVIDSIDDIVAVGHRLAFSRVSPLFQRDHPRGFEGHRGHHRDVPPCTCPACSPASAPARTPSPARSRSPSTTTPST